MIVAGIDEAGLGPVLGPLVMAGAVMDVPEGAESTSLWRLLSGTVTRRPSRTRATVCFADSKLLYAGRDAGAGVLHLERGVLAALACLGHRPRSLDELLAILAPGAMRRAQRYPWYRDAELALPVCVDPTAADDLGERLERRMVRAGVRLLALRAHPLYAGEFNRLLAAAGNKAHLHFAVTAPLLRRIRARQVDRRAIVHVDRQGGRKFYRERLQQAFPGSFVWILGEDPSTSSYRVETGDRSLELHFTVGCEEAQLPVALASMAAKYVRELFMVLFNRYWQRQVPGLLPTAGYHRDGRRFWRDIGPAVARLGFEGALLYRLR